MGCPSEDNIVIYSSDSTVCKTTYNYSTHTGMTVLAKTIIIGGEVPTPETMCISYGHWKNWINCCDVYSQIRVNGTVILANYAGNSYETPGITYPLQTGDVVTLYVNSFYTSAQSCVNNFRVSRINAFSPVADIGGPYIGSIGNPVTFDGSGSADPDGLIALYEWDFGDGDTDTGESVVHVFSVVDTYAVSLTVTDEGGLTDVDSTSVVIHEAPLVDDTSPDTFSFGRAGKKRRHKIEV